MIKLFRHAGWWAAEFVDDPEVLKLFGTSVLPTGFAASVPAEKVLGEIQKRNPGTLVVLEV